MSAARPLASISLDLDNLWSYLKTHGESGWESRPSYLARFVPPVLELLDRQDLKITFFVVGVDADDDAHADALHALAAHGHEIGNHSYEHEPWLHRYDRQALYDDVVRAELAIERVTGQRPVGFRGPGYSWSPELLTLLSDRGYVYDASTLPTVIGPLARVYYFRTAKLDEAARRERAELFGTFRDGLRPIDPYRWQLEGERTLLEIPVTTFPGLRVPFHLSYLLYLARFSERVMDAYLRSALLACRMTRTEPSVLLHPLDLIGEDLDPRLRFFPGMDVPSRRKVELFARVLSTIARYFTPVTMGEHARALLARGGLRTVRPERRADEGDARSAAGAAPRPSLAARPSARAEAE